MKAHKESIKKPKTLPTLTFRSSTTCTKRREDTKREEEGTEMATSASETENTTAPENTVGEEITLFRRRRR